MGQSVHGDHGYRGKVGSINRSLINDADGPGPKVKTRWQELSEGERGQVAAVAYKDVAEGTVRGKRGSKTDVLRHMLLDCSTSPHATSLCCINLSLLHSLSGG